MNLEFNYQNFKNVAGCDEAGRGCLAGPVVAAAVILGKPIAELNDSKKLREIDRNRLSKIIKETAIAYSIAFVDEKRIDEINILNASIEAMHLALNCISASIDIILIDGNRFKPYKNIASETIIKGDQKYQCIAAASILAKTARDEWMRKAALIFPNYGWTHNFGYPTKYHRAAIAGLGACELHRKSFKLL